MNNMNIGSLYEIKKRYWFVYPDQVAANRATNLDPSNDFVAVLSNPVNWSEFWSGILKCEVPYISPKDLFCLLEREDNFCKVLSNKGELGWIVLTDSYSKDIEEVVL